jgi:hypothetical protein
LSAHVQVIGDKKKLNRSLKINHQHTPGMTGSKPLVCRSIADVVSFGSHMIRLSDAMVRMLPLP